MVTGLLVLLGVVDRGAVAGPAALAVVAGRELVQGAEALDFGLVCGDDPPVGRPGVLAAGDPASSEPSEQGGGRHADLAGQGCQPPLPGLQAALAGAVVVVQAWAQAQPPDQVLDCAGMEAVVQAGVRKPSAASWPAIAALSRPCPASALIRSARAG